MKPTYLALAGLILSGMYFSDDATAATVQRNYLSHGTANCQSALPAFDGNIRKRPMAIGNEGTSTAFLTCDTESISNYGPGFLVVAVYLRNRAAAADITVNCTLVSGIFVPAIAIPMTSGAIPQGGTATISWSAEDEDDDTLRAPGISCALPPGIDISAVQYVYPEEVGALQP